MTPLDPPDPHDLRGGRALSSSDPRPAISGANPRPIDSETLRRAPSFSEPRYVDGASLGAGGMADVILTRDARLGRDVAKKVTKPGYRARADLETRFLREARVQGQLEHPAIVPVYDLGTTPEGDVFFTMRRIRGRALDGIVHALSEGDPDTAHKHTRNRLLGAFQQVCLALDYAHSRGVIHRDLKPGNVMLGDFGEVYVLDWGLAKLVGEHDDAVTADPVPTESGTRSVTQDGAVMGTPGYMAPEQVRGEMDTLDARADVYSLGAILFELLAWQPLHNAPTPEGRLADTIVGVDGRPSARAPMRDIPPELDAICAAACATDREARFSNARALHDAIDRFLDGDRDLSHRRDVARKHIQNAQALAARATEGGKIGTSDRAGAMREISQALAFDPHNIEASRTLAKLLLEPPHVMPPEAMREYEKAIVAETQFAARVGVGVYASWFLYLPLLLLMGVHDPRPMIVGIPAALATVALAWRMSRMEVPTAAVQYLTLITSTITIAVYAFIFGPLVFVPGIATVNTLSFAMTHVPKRRMAFIAIGCLAIVVPFLAEVAGLVPPSYEFRDGLFIMLPRAVQFPELTTTIFLFTTGLAMLITSSAFMGRLRHALTRAEEQLFLQTWQLKQLVPDEARAAVSALERPSEQPPRPRSSP